jgi:hypothetical protein
MSATSFYQSVPTHDLGFTIPVTYTNIVAGQSGPAGATVFFTFENFNVPVGTSNPPNTVAIFRVSISSGGTFNTTTVGSFTLNEIDPKWSTLGNSVGLRVNSLGYDHTDGNLVMVLGSSKNLATIDNIGYYAKVSANDGSLMWKTKYDSRIPNTFELEEGSHPPNTDPDGPPIIDMGILRAGLPAYNITSSNIGVMDKHGFGIIDGPTGIWKLFSTKFELALQETGFTALPQEFFGLIWNSIALTPDGSLFLTYTRYDGPGGYAPDPVFGTTSFLADLAIVQPAPSDDEGDGPLFDKGPKDTPEIITPWSFDEPDWLNGVTERLLWKTDVLSSQTGIEQRRRLRNAPRRQIEAAFTLIGQTRRLYDNIMNNVGASHTFNYPLWWEKYFLVAPATAGDTTILVTDMSFSEVTSDDIILIRGTSPFVYEIATIQTFAPRVLELKDPLVRDWPTSTTRIYLTKLCRITGVQRGNRRADDAAQVTLTLDTVEPNDYTGIPPTQTYFNVPVLNLFPDEAQDLTVEYTRLIQEFDNQTARVPIRRDLGNQSFMLQQFSWFAMGRKALADLRGLLYFLEGKRTPMYVPTYYRDAELMTRTIFPAGTTTVVVTRSGFTEMIKSYLDNNVTLPRTRRLMMFQFNDGYNFVRQVVSGTILSDDFEELGFDSPFDRDVSNGVTLRLCWLAYSRQDQDEIEILHHADGLGPATIVTTFATMAEGRNAQPYSTDVWNGSFHQDTGVTPPAPPPPDGPAPPISIDQVPPTQGDFGSGGDHGGEGGGDGGGDGSEGDGGDSGDSGGGDSGDGGDSGGGGGEGRMVPMLPIGVG